MGILTTGLKTLHCTDQVACGDVITDTLWNKQAEAIEGLYTAGWMAADGPHVFDGKYKPRCGYAEGTYQFPNAQGSHAGVGGKMWHPITLHDGITHFSLVCEYKPMFVGGGGIPPAPNFSSVMSRARFYLTGYTASGPAPTQTLLDVVAANPGYTVSPSGGQVLQIVGAKQVHSVYGTVNSSLLPPAGTLWDARFRIDIDMNNEKLIPNLNYVGPGTNWFTISDWFGVFYYQLKFYREC